MAAAPPPKRKALRKSCSLPTIGRADKLRLRKAEATNATAELTAFLEEGRSPRFSFRGDEEFLARRLRKPKHRVSEALVPEALAVLGAVRARYGEECPTSPDARADERGRTEDRPTTPDTRIGDEVFVNAFMGPRIERSEAERIVAEYLACNEIADKVSVKWAANLHIAGKFTEVGSKTDPTKRRLRVVIRDDYPGVVRACGVKSFLHHEIGTHAVRALNERVQPWATARKKFGMVALGSREAGATEEGLASLHTLLGAPAEHRYLWTAALLYYAAAQGQRMTFRELHEHLGSWVSNPVRRFWVCTRVKRGVADNSTVGASGLSQIYFEGAVRICRSLDDPDFEPRLLFMGKVAVGNLPRVKRLARTSSVTIPRFVDQGDGGYAGYCARLRAVAVLNGLLPPTPTPSLGRLPPVPHLKVASAIDANPEQTHPVPTANANAPPDAAH